MHNSTALPKLDVAKLAYLRGLRAGFSFSIAECELHIVTEQSRRQETIEHLRTAEDDVRAELRAAGVPEAECTLHHADRLVDAFMEGQATVKLGSFTSDPKAPEPVGEVFVS